MTRTPVSDPSSSPDSSQISDASSPVALLGRVPSGLLLGLGTAIGAVALATANGGYFPPAWGWSALVLAWLAALALLLRDRVFVGRLEFVFVGALVLFVSWVAASIAWSQDVPGSVLEVERDIVYVLGVLTALLVVRTRSMPYLLGGLLTAISAVGAYSLSSRFFPAPGSVVDVITLNRLAGPIGYWNALAVFSSMGALLALGFAARGRGVLIRSAAAATLPILLATLYFTYSRGGWLALGAGLLAALLLDLSRLQLITIAFLLAPPSVAAVWISSRQHGLTQLTASNHVIRSEGRYLAIVLVVLAGISAATAAFAALAERRVNPPRFVRIAYGLALVVLAAVLLGSVFVRYGSPSDLARRAYRSFENKPPATAPAAPAKPAGPVNLNNRLFTLRSNGRIQFWRAAWDDHKSHPWLGSGAGSYEQYWFQHRPFPAKVRDAHGLYVEVVGELGWGGLALLVVALGTPLVAAFRVRARRLAPAAFGAYVAFVVHAGVDWDWEMPAVTLTGLLCGAALVVAARRNGSRIVTIPQRARIAALPVLALIAAFAFVGLMGNSALHASRTAYAEEKLAHSEAEARKAKRWAPWSAQPWQQIALSEVQHPIRARAALRTALEKSPRDWNLWYLLATQSGGRTRQQALAEALRLNPLGPEVRQLQAALAGG